MYPNTIHNNNNNNTTTTTTTTTTTNNNNKNKLHERCLRIIKNHFLKIY